MILKKLVNNSSFKECIFSLRENVPRQRFCSSSALIAEESEKESPKKVLKVAILGRPNSGKSTLINRILDLNVCDVSSKTHTTQSSLKASYISGDTQIVFVDTPGLVTKKECRKFELGKNFLEPKLKLFRDVDMIGAMFDMSRFYKSIKFHSNLVETLNEIPKSKPIFLILNKIDLLKDKSSILPAIDELMYEREKNSRTWNEFCKVFMVSALKNEGVKDLVDYLRQQAKPGKWLFEPGKVSNTPTHILVANVLRGKILDILPHEIPYSLSFDVEYLEENDYGELICVALVTAKERKHMEMLIRKKNLLKIISKSIESDLYRILNRTFKLRIVVSSKEKSE